MKATVYSAEQGDLLTLELAYKHDLIVLELIRQLRLSQEMDAAASELLEKEEGKTAELEDDKATLHRDVESLKTAIDDAAKGLNAIMDYKKAEMIEEMKDIISELEHAHENH